MIKSFSPAAAAAILIFPLTASAHARLLSSAPSAGMQLAAAPTALTLDFNESVRLAALTISAAGKDIPVPYDRAAAVSHLAVPLPVLGPGTYQVRWSALTVDDGHVVKGAFSFVIKP